MFSVGNKITGKKDAPYVYTTSDATMIVIKVSGKKIEVEIIDHKFPNNIGMKCNVDSKFFIKINDKFEKRKERMLNA